MDQPVCDCLEESSRLLLAACNCGWFIQDITTSTAFCQQKSLADSVWKGNSKKIRKAWGKSGALWVDNLILFWTRYAKT